MNDARTGAGGRAALAWALGTAGLFAALVAWGAWNHEMWRDELQAWLLARDSATPGALVRAARYEGHPLLWHGALWVLSRLTPLPQPMQALHALVAVASAWLVARHAPFARAERLALVCGYLLLYEYGVVCRNYGPGVFLLFAYCARYPARFRRLPACAALLGLAGLTSVHALVLAFAAAVALLAEYAVRGRRERDAAPAGVALACATALAAAFAFSAWLMRPPPDSGWAVGWTFDWQPDRARGVVRSLGRAFLAWPRAGVGFWGSSRLDETAWWPAHGTAASLLLPLPVLAVALRRPFAALFYAAATLGLLAFLYVKFPGSLRHHGFFYIAAVAALWMARADRPSPPAPARGRRRWLDAAGWAVRPCLWAVLAVQAAGAWTALAADARHPFSGARETGRFLRAQGLDRLPIVAHRGPETSAVVGYAAIPRVFYAGPGRWGSFVVWDRDWDAPASFDDLIAAVARLRAGGNPRVMLLSNRQLPPRLARQRGLRPLFESAAGTVGGEQFFLYLSEGAESPREPSR